MTPIRLNPPGIRTGLRPVFEKPLDQGAFENNKNRLIYYVAQLIRVLVFSLSIVILASGCASSGRTGPGFTTSSKHSETGTRSSLTRVIGDPNVWAPLLTATLLQIDDLDHEISDRLREDTPLFGSAQNAADLSDNFRDLTEVGYISTALMVPGPETTGAWISNKVVLVGTESLVVSMGQMVSGEVKSTTGRERPNKTNNRSFASGHTSTATMQAQMANLNVDHLQIEATTKRGLNFGFNSVAALTGWARVEAGEHYPSDVLAGWALGYLMSNFGKEIIKPDRLRIMVRPRANPDAGGIELIIKF